MFDVCEVPDDADKVHENSFEPVGTKFKFWFEDHLGRRLLFKQVTTGSGEDWSEKVAAELCELLGLPHARYDLAIWRGTRGVVSHSFVPPRGRLIFGNELLMRIHSDYPTGKRYYRVPEHTLGRVLAVMRNRGFQVPLGWRPFSAVTTALDVFVGYLMLDAWISNQDRHHQNWGLLHSPTSGVHLAPTFDHASSLGRNETDETRRRRLAAKDFHRGIPGYLDRARSAFYDSPKSSKPMPPLDAFRRASAFGSEAAKTWLGRLATISEGDVRRILEEIPRDRISQEGVDFAAAMLDENGKRLLAG